MIADAGAPSEFKTMRTAASRLTAAVVIEKRPLSCFNVILYFFMLLPLFSLFPKFESRAATVARV
jgi:hypothetical protein